MTIIKYKFSHIMCLNNYKNYHIPRKHFTYCHKKIKNYDMAKIVTIYFFSKILGSVKSTTRILKLNYVLILFRTLNIDKIYMT